MDSAPRASGRIGPRTLLITTAAMPLAGWTVHAISLHRKLASVRRDPLTGLLGRDGYTTKARQTLDRYGDSALVTLVDLDHFKQINDGRGGHAAGDRVLVAPAQRLTSWAGSRGAVGRLGGDDVFSRRLAGRLLSAARFRSGARLTLDLVQGPECRVWRTTCAALARWPATAAWA
ncbi:GGDEF domain-containing protein [Streptomyces sp. NPDC048516]|uniref:GGDEF domain-containing protein n=1 Tax=Streptomyces sp. NPDC048516 TaxID=3365565 RepID=UPI00371D67A9